MSKLIAAVQAGDIEKVKELVESFTSQEKKIAINYQDRFGMTALMFACAMVKVDIAIYLIDQGANVNLRTNSVALDNKTILKFGEGRNALIFACAARDKKIIKSLPANEVVKNQELIERSLAKGDQKAADEVAKNQESLELLIADGDKEMAKMQELIKVLLDNGADANILLPQGHTALALAAASGDTELVNLLLEENINYTIKADAFFYASQYGKRDVMKILADNGVDINILFTNANVLMLAAKSGDIQLVQFLIDLGADVGFKNAEGQTALIIALLSGNEDVAQLLVDNGADVGEVDKLGVTPIMIAAKKCSIAMVECLLNKIDPLKRLDYLNITNNNDGATALILAADAGKMEMVRFLVDYGVLVNKKAYGREALSWVLSLGALDDVTYLLDRGADINAQDQYGNSVVMYAVLKNEIELLEVLINKGADISMSNYKNNSPLMVAVYNKNFEIAKMLGAAGASLSNLDQLMEKHSLPEDITQLIKALFHIDVILATESIIQEVNYGYFKKARSIIDDAVVNKDQFYEEHIEVVAARIVYRLTKFTLPNNINSLEEYLSKYADRIKPELMSQIQEAIIIYNIANNLYLGENYKGDLPEISAAMIEKITDFFEIKVKKDIWGTPDYSKMTKGINEGAWPEELKISIALQVKKYSDLSNGYDSDYCLLAGEVEGQYVESEVEMLGEFGIET